jgi:signal transduction histidine kinase
MAEKKLKTEYHFLQGGGEMGELTRNYDWSKNVLGTPDMWPQSLRTTISIVLNSAFPMVLFWGKDLTCFYNDAFLPSLGIDGKHPGIGKPGKEVWADIWDFIGPLIEKVMKTKEPVWFEDQLVPFYRNGKTEEIYWTFSYSPTYKEDGQVAGVFVTCTETTDKVITVKKLKENEDNLRSLILQAPIGICVLDAPSLISEIVNDSFIEIAGKPYEDIVGKFYWDTFAEARPYYEEALNKVVKDGVPFYANEIDLMLIRNGKEENIYVTFVYAPLKDAEGKVKKITVWVLENTPQVISRQKVEQSEQEIRSLIESAPFPIGVYKGKEMRVAFANKSIMDIWGKGTNVIGKLFSEVLPELDNQEVFKQLAEVYRTGIAFHIKNQPLDLIVDGKPYKYYFNYSLTPLFDSAGKVYGVMNTGVDLTELNLAKRKIEQSEQNIRNMILQAPVAMCILKGGDFVVEIANDRMIELWGKQKEDVDNKPLFIGVPEAKAQGFEGLLEGVYTTGKTFAAEGVPITLLRNGKIADVFVNFVYEPFREPDGSISGVLVVAIDSTAQVVARQKIEEAVTERTKELADANNNLQKSNAELAQFAYIASHDLQEPLRKIGTFSQMLEKSLEGKLEENSKNYFNKINNSTTRMNVLIRDVLAYSELVKQTDLFVEVDLNQILENVKVDYDLLIEEKDAAIQSNKLPIITAIPLQMSQLFGNIIGNSLKFVRKDVKPIIKITASKLDVKMVEYLFLDNTLDYYKIEFADNGIGFKEEYAEQIFNIFQRLHRKSEFEGTGIGLAMCKKIALNHHGNMCATGSSENGAVFNVILPLSQH